MCPNNLPKYHMWVPIYGGHSWVRWSRKWGWILKWASFTSDLELGEMASSNRFLRDPLPLSELVNIRSLPWNSQTSGSWMESSICEMHMCKYKWKKFLRCENTGPQPICSQSTVAARCHLNIRNYPVLHSSHHSLLSVPGRKTRSVAIIVLVPSFPL